MHGPDLQRTWTEEDLDLYDQFSCIEARESYLAYRLLLDPSLVMGWFQQDIASHLQQFYDDMLSGKRPVLLLQSPPQHGKTTQVRDLISWIAGKNPDLRAMFTSYSDDLGIGVNIGLQRTYDSERYQKIFDTRISQTNVVTLSGRFLRNSSLIEYVNHKGSFRNTTVMGQINGMGLDLGIIDDPMKGRKEAQSKTQRDSVWGWLTDDFFGRFSKNAGFIMIMTRWHVDDPAGRWLDRFPNTKVLKYPAIATEDETYRKKGEALFPELKPLDFLLERKKLMTIAGFESVYQQSPIIVGGGIFPIELIDINPQLVKKEIKKSVRYWDKAGTEDGGAFTAGVLMHMMKDNTFVIEDVRHGQWNSMDREKRIKQTAQADRASGRTVYTYVEQEPGSGGKESAESTIRNLAGFNITADKVTGDKETRAEPYAAQVQGGNVSLIEGEWNISFLDEHETFPNGKYKDQVDAAAGAFNKLTLGSHYDASYNWVG